MHTHAATQMEGAKEMKLPYIPEHLHYIFFELLKNSMRAVVERSHTLYTPHPTPYTLHPTPYTLHPTPYTLHPKFNLCCL